MKKPFLRVFKQKNQQEITPDYKLALKMGRLALNKTPVKNEALSMIRNKKYLKKSARSKTKSPNRSQLNFLKHQRKDI